MRMLVSRSVQALCGSLWKGKQLLQLQQLTCFVPAASLWATRGEKREKEFADWPYQKVTYNRAWMWVDNTMKRITENSKVVCVEGNIAVGKTKFAKRFAKEFDFYHLPHITPNDWYRVDFSGFDMRDLNYQLSDGAKFWDLEQFYNNPERMGKTLWLQEAFYRSRFKDAMILYTHLFSTGQGVVMERSPWSDQVFADTLYRLGYLDQAAYDWYYSVRNVTVRAFWRPHLIVYIDTPIDVVMEKIRQRNIPYEVNSPIMTEKYLRTIDEVYKEKIFDFAKSWCELLVVPHDQFETDADWDIIVDQVEEMDLENDATSYFQKKNFNEWANPDESNWNWLRQRLCDHNFYEQCFDGLAPCFEHPESFWWGELWEEVMNTLRWFPQAGHVNRPGWNAEDKGVYLPFLNRKMQKFRRQYNPYKNFINSRFLFAETN